MTARNLDVLKWVAAIAMVVDHVWLYVFGATQVSEALGSLAFPLFALALGEGVKAQHDVSRERTMVRLLLGACVAQAAVLLVRELQPLNVIFTLACGVAADTAWRSRRVTCGVVASLSFVVLGFVCEYNHPGVFFVLALARWCATRSQIWLALSIAGLALLAPFNGNHWALAAPVVAALVSLAPRDAPRVKNAFYFVYALQWPFIALLRVL